MSEPWIHKYLPTSSKGIVGHPTAIARANALIDTWSRKSKPIWLWGATGNGKTSSAIGFAKEKSLELVEVNASDARNAQAIEERIGGAIKQGSLFGTSKLVLIDEVDGLSGRKDRGGIPTLIKLIKGSSYPIVITGTDPFDKKFSALRKVCELVEFKTLSYKSIALHVVGILKKENIEFEQAAVDKIAMAAGGDMRAAINDAQVFSNNGKLTVKDLELLGGREKTEKINNALLRVFKTTQAAVAKGAFDNVDEDIDHVMLWLDENLPTEYTKPLDLKRAYDALGDADKFLGRIRRWQHYRFYVYAYDLVTAGVAVAKDEKYKGFTSYKQTSRLLQIWMANQKNLKKKAIAEKVAEKTHTSKKEAIETIPFLQHIFLNNDELATNLASAFDFDKEEVGWLKK